MRTFSVECEVINLYERSKMTSLEAVLVDTGSEYTWVPRAELESIGVAVEKENLTFVMANGQQVTRSVGFAIVKIGDNFTVDEVVFAEHVLWKA